MQQPSLTKGQLLLNFPANPEYRFENFYTSTQSELTLKTCKEICSNKELQHQSIYISGDKGQGKTHLLISIGNFLAEHYPHVKTLYMHCLDFIQSMERDKKEKANKTLFQLQAVDYFLLDDVDLIAGHSLAQEKLYSLYNFLRDQDKVIVFTGRKSPNQLKNIESFLTSRFLWGMTVKLYPMDDQTTHQIIKKLGNDFGLGIPDKVITFLLNRIPRDYLTIKNSVIRLNDESLKQKKKVTLQLAKTALGL